MNTCFLRFCPNGRLFLFWIVLFFTITKIHSQKNPIEFTAMTWNIWKGGRMDGDSVGPIKIIDVIKKSGADIIAMQETYGSGELISKQIGFHFHPRGTNVSIMSKFPIEEDISVFEEFKCVGAIILLPNNQKVAFYSIWLPYDGEIWEKGTRNPNDTPVMLAACASSAIDLQSIRVAIEKRLSDKKYNNVPIIIAGDFNSMSHLDYADIAYDQYKSVVDWPTSHILTDAGYRDSWKETHPAIDRNIDRTWTPRFPDQEQDRIDYIYYRGSQLKILETQKLDKHKDGFPSDHAGVVAKFIYQVKPTKEKNTKIRIVSYNIRRGLGMDDSTNIYRTAESLKTLNADIIGLQEVDMGVKRSGNVNQAAILGKQLGMYASFGPFMDYQGGRYGMAILSRYPMRNVKKVILPIGNEPRVALVAELILPNDSTILVVNVHFDWVSDDHFRYDQAQTLAEYLINKNTPYILLGDFNDEPTSRTLSLFRKIAREIKKPSKNHNTFPSTKPIKEIDYIFVHPDSRWSNTTCQVILDQITSDHCPILTEIELYPSNKSVIKK